MQIYETFLDTMGNTPLVRLHSVTRGVRPTVTWEEKKVIDVFFSTN
jgi:hypothetical protein